MYISPKRLYLNADRTKAVEDGPEADTLLVAAGGQLTDEVAARYGLGQKAAPKAANKAAAKGEDK